MRVLLRDKRTKEVAEVLAEGLTEKEAEGICEAWGWNYIDENGKSFWIEYEEDET